ncbi:recombinase family protein [Thermosynechococcaceae cyanobacterium BACA0444]|uniref:Recombinase family protein n=1 Tax=Pseudocalidococcus azoricus BACA0444 TaxID=2918990 RepID=A0AAE4JZW2_9CYAN|nr:recombinase family protein [Pseudocalidococcus azoricus]MDS3861282.1 recombinase family protein [Pseudocalidococcus azoricus BACA0444]
MSSTSAPAPALWICGGVQSGKTTRLVRELKTWINQTQLPGGTAYPRRGELARKVLIMAANAENGQRLRERISQTIGQGLPLSVTTPLGFFPEEVILFWPLIVQHLNIPGLMPVRLQAETEQYLALKLWSPELDAGVFRAISESAPLVVQNLINLMELAAFAGLPLAGLGELLVTRADYDPDLGAAITQAILQWRSWCLARGLLTYGILLELYGQVLLPQAHYQAQLRQRYDAVLADDLDNYPALARDLFQVLLAQRVRGVFTFNPSGGCRLGLGADPDYLAGLAAFCRVEQLPDRDQSVLGGDPQALVSYWLTDARPQLPETLQSLQTASRMELLTTVAGTITQAVQSQTITPAEIAIIGPGLDAIARYILSQNLNQAGIPLYALNDQRPLISSPLVRAILTLLPLIYPECGRGLEREAIAEMLVVLFQEKGEIDPVRAGLLADHCFIPDPDNPSLIAATEFSRWDRLGYQTCQAYEGLRTWIQDQQNQLADVPRSPVFMMDRAIQRFLWSRNLNYNQILDLRKLLEISQHYWDVQRRLAQHSTASSPAYADYPAVATFFRFIRTAPITTNPRLPRPIPAVTLATTFQYRNSRLKHRWQFWLDVGGPLWQNGGLVTRWQSPLLLRSPTGDHAEIWNDEIARLQRLLVDIGSRTTERIYLCHSELAVNGQEQMGPLLGLVELVNPVA